MTARMLSVVAVATALVGVGASGAAFQTTGGTRPPLVIDSMAGSDLYAFYCASCHGRGGAGDGPTAPALRTPTSDLTTLARRAGGIFPTERVRGLVTHGEALASPAHGSRDMPVWGPIFRALDPDDTRTRVRIDAIVQHVASMQVR